MEPRSLRHSTKRRREKGGRPGILGSGKQRGAEDQSNVDFGGLWIKYTCKEEDTNLPLK